MTEEYDGSTELPDARQELFCQQYVVDFVGARAAIRAGYSEKAARQQANTLLSKTDIQARVNYLAKQVRESVKVDAEYVLRELVKQYETDLSAIQDEFGMFIDPKDWPEDVKRVVTGMDMSMLADKDGNTAGMLVGKVRRTDRLKALELLGKHKAIQAFKEQVELEAGENMVSAILQARKRARGEGDEE